MPTNLELDRKIIAALQINPRIAWTRLGQIISADPTTLSRRWDSMIASNKVWTTSFVRNPTPQVNHVRVAHIDISCLPGRRDEVISAMREEKSIYGIKCITGDHDIQVEIAGNNLVSIDRLIQEQIVTAPGISMIKTNFLHTVFHDGTMWRLRALSKAQESAVSKTIPDRSFPIEPSPAHLKIIAALDRDLRASVVEIGADTGYSSSTVSRHIETIMAASWAHARIDLAHNHMGWEAEVMLNLQVDNGILPQVVATLKDLADLRLCASTSGSANLTAVIWLRRLNDIDLLEHLIRKAHPSIRILERWVVPRTAKRFGQILNPDGLAEKFVPIGIPIAKPGE